MKIINVNKVKDIPVDYYGPMGVPITFMLKWDPNQFVILGDCIRPVIKDKLLYTRIIIIRKDSPLLWYHNILIEKI